MKKICIIENIDSIADFFSDYLSLKGYKIAISDNVEDFSLRFDGFNPDLVIFDTDMPRSESYKFANLKASNSRLMPIPTILLTGFVNEAKINGFEEIVNYEFLSKSGTNSQILRKIENLMEHSHPESNTSYNSRNPAEVTSLNN